MLDEKEYSEALKLYGEAFKRKGSRERKFKPLLKFYKKVTGVVETEPNAIMHHRLSIYGLPCDNCGKPYRTPKASYCAACGNVKESESY